MADCIEIEINLGEEEEKGGSISTRRGNVFYCNIGMSIELFNQILDFQITREIKGMRLEDSEKAKKKLDVLDNGEPIVIPFVSDVLDADIHYCDMFYFEKAET